MRKKRYRLMAPASAACMLVPYMNLSPELRQRVILEEMAEGRSVWSDMTATLNGNPMTVSACREWGAFLFGGRIIVLDHYPLQSLDVQVPVVDVTADTRGQPEPITEERKITTKYRVTAKKGYCHMLFAPVQRVQQLDTGELTELPDINLNLSDKLRQNFSEMKIGDEKEFSLTVRVLTGYRPNPFL